MIFFSFFPFQGNDIRLLHEPQDATIPSDEAKMFVVPIHEDFWTRTDGLQVDREHLLMALADVDFILIRASDNDKEPR